MELTAELLQEQLRFLADEPPYSAAQVLAQTTLPQPLHSDQITELLEVIRRHQPLGGAQNAMVCHVLAMFCQRTFEQPGAGWQESPLEQVKVFYREEPEEAETRAFLLRWLASSSDRDALRLFCELVVDDPPRNSRLAAAAFGPLFHEDVTGLDALFPRLLDGLAHRSVAPLILDLANFVTRSQRLERHPAGDRAVELTALLGQITDRLAQLERHPPGASGGLGEVGKQVEEGVALAVGLCDALGQIGDPQAGGKLHQAMQLRHRRVQSEAAGALAKLGEQAGVDALVQLAEHPVARLRVLAYAEELGVLENIPDSHRNEVARAEAELVLWLAQPTQLGTAPTQCELVERQMMYWPSYDEPVDCFLFRFTYELAGGQYSNIGIAGPLAHTFTADLADLPHADIFAAFAGWQAEHEEIHETPVAQLTEAQRVDVSRLQRRLRDAGYERIEPLQLGYFFGLRTLVARAWLDGEPGTAVTDPDELVWFPSGRGPRPLGPAEVYCIYKGRRLLRTFNP